MLSHVFGDSAQSNAREVVDGEARILGVIKREHASATLPDFWVLESLRKHLEAHLLVNLLQHNLDEDT